MHLSFIQNDFVVALCWTLIHSLWQGLLLAIITGIAMIATRKSDAGKRYRFLTFLFFLFLGVTAITFVKELNKPKSNTTLSEQFVPATTDQVSISNIVATSTTGAGMGQRLMYLSKEYFNTHAYLIVTIWFIIFMARFIRFSANLLYVQRLKNYRTNEISNEWKKKLQQLIIRLEIHKNIRLLESSLVKVPVVMGVFKPLILLPIGLLAQLREDEIEAILLHELAHIQRSDFFVNLLQSFAETIFFFNPALMWVSSMIREERENCCDDVAISVTNSKVTFINALIAFQECKFPSSYAVGFPGKKNQLLNRVKRIVNEKNKTLNTAEKSVLTLGMAVLILFSFAAAKKVSPPATDPVKMTSTPSKDSVVIHYSVNEMSDSSVQTNSTLEETAKSYRILSYSPIVIATSGIYSQPRSVTADPISLSILSSYGPTPHITRDTVPTKKSFARPSFEKDSNPKSDSIAALFTNVSIYFNENDASNVVSITAIRKDGRTYILKKVDGAISEFSIDNEQISRDQLKDHANELNDLEAVYKARREKLTWKRQTYVKSDVLDSARSMALVNRQKLLIDNQQSLIDRQMQYLKAKLANFEGNNSQFNAKQQSLLHAQMFTLKKQQVLLANALQPNDKRIILKGGNDDGGSIRITDVVSQKQIDDDAQFRASVEQIKNIISDLRMEHININERESSFGLDNKQFIVDGKPMSHELHEKFKARYVGPDGMGYYYGTQHISGRGVFLDYNTTYASSVQ